MKYKVLDLENRKIKSIEGEIDFSSKKNNEYVDISTCRVDGSYQYDKDFDMFKFFLHVEVEITVLSCISLDKVKVLVDFDTDLFYTFKVSDDDSFPINGNEIELDEEIWGVIMLHMPTRVFKEGEEFVPEDDEKIEKANPFMALSLEDEEDK